MSKLVVILIPGGAPEYLTVDDDQKSITWFNSAEVPGHAGYMLPIETYFCEGEEFHFARIESLPEGEEASTISYLTAQKTDALAGLMSSFRQGIAVISQILNIDGGKRIRAK
ncbi:hypothetical protein KXR87_17360 [Yokenella regensburgei]|uniref:hypothetical protein n=1 Tax=Yokenella regensburgei TaxID=158877 RepID=UPI003F17CE6A